MCKSSIFFSQNFETFDVLVLELRGQVKQAPIQKIQIFGIEKKIFW